MSKSTRISRRTVLRGIGTAIALPWLEAKLPRVACGAETPKPPVRMAFLSVPNGKHMPDWTPDKAGTDFELKSTLQPIAKFKSQMLQLSGLALDGGEAHGDGPGDHARSCASFLTGAHPKKTDGADIYNGISVDQLAAEKIGHQTRFPSLELGIERGAQSGNCDSGYSCAYSANVAWRTPTSPVAKEIDPTAVFDRLFGEGDSGEQGLAKAKRERYRKSVLDFVLEDAKQLQSRLGASDQRKLDEYLYAVRDIERRIGGVDKLAGAEQGINFSRPAGVPAKFEDHTKLLFDLMTLAFQTDSTRVISFMYANEGSNRNYPEVNVNEGHHNLSHHGNKAEKQALISQINRYHITLLSHLLERLASIKEGDRTLLDNSMIFYGSGIGDGNRHNHDDLPIAVFGRGGGALKTGRHNIYPKDTPLTNLYRTMLDIGGAHVDSFSDSTSLLEDVLA
jgi:hypothetical protein